MRLEGKTALISGAGRNMGRSIALAFAAAGADLVLVARTEKEVVQTAADCEKLGVRALGQVGDVGQHQDVERVAAAGLRHYGKIDHLVSVAAIRPHRPVAQVSYEEWHRVFDVNLHATFYLAKALAPAMMERRSGSIVALGGMASLTAPLPHTTAVVASKHGLYGLIKSLALELGPYNVRANLIAVGSISTERRNPEWYPPGENPHTDSTWHNNTPLRRDGSVEEIANVALFLASDAASYVTGDRIIVAGGKYM